MSEKKEARTIKQSLLFSPYLWLFLVTSVLFGILFVRFILGDYAYLYLDVGADTFDINYPLYRMFSRVFHGEGYSDYFLNAGLGMDMSSYLFQYLNPLNLLVVMLPQKWIPWGILLATYLKLLMISFFGYGFFRMHMGHGYGSFCGALVWTFSSYVILWGQHYGFCTSIAMFTVFFYLLHRYVEKREKSRNGILVLWITLMLFTNYYFLYMSGLMGALYVIVYMALGKKPLPEILKKLAGLAGMGLLGIAIGGVCLVPTLNGFLDSIRASAFNVAEGHRLLLPYSSPWRYGFLGRLYSNNALGLGNDYSGAGNYYEMAMLGTSCLFVFAQPYLFMGKKTHKNTVILSVLSLFMLLFPLTGKIFNLNSSTQRWSFFLCFLEAYAIGMYVKCLLEEKERRKVAASVLSGWLFTAAVYILLVMGEKRGYYKLSMRYLLPPVVFLGLYGLLLLGKICLEKRQAFRKQEVTRCTKAFALLLISMLCAELVVANYPTINSRELPTRNQVAVEYYNDGTVQGAEALRELDGGPYRVAKTYESASENDGMGQNYPGLSVYLAANPIELIQLKNMYGGKGISINFANFEAEDFLRNALLGTKYLIAMPGDGISQGNYEYLGEAGGKELYQYRYSLPFGYLYDKKWEKKDLLEMDVNHRVLASLEGFHYGGRASATEYEVCEALDELQETSVMDGAFQSMDCAIEEEAAGITMSQMTEDPHIVWEDVGDVFTQGAVHTVTVQVDAKEPVDMALYYQLEQDEGFRQDQICIFQITPQEDTWTGILPEDVTALRLDVSTEIEKVTIEEVAVGNCPGLNEAYEKLRSSKVSEVAFADGRYSAQVENEQEQVQMLCVPLLYGKGWTGAIDGEKVPVYNINSGLCGIEIPSGSHQVTLTYQTPHKAAGMCLSGVGLLLYLGMLLVSHRKKKGGMK